MLDSWFQAYFLFLLRTQITSSAILNNLIANTYIKFYIDYELIKVLKIHVNKFRT